MSPAATMLKYGKFESDFNNNMDHMRIPSSETSSEILSQTMLLKQLKCDIQNAKQTEVKRDCEINPENYNFTQFLIWKILMP